MKILGFAHISLIQQHVVVWAFCVCGCFAGVACEVGNARKTAIGNERHRARAKTALKRQRAPPASLRQQARTAQEAAERAASSSVPLWAIAAILALGWNEVVWLLRHPVYTFILGVVGLFGRAVLSQIDVAGAMRLGVIPGLVLIFGKVVPAALVVVQKLVRALCCVVLFCR